MLRQLNTNDEFIKLVNKVNELEEERINYMCELCCLKQQCRCDNCTVSIINIK